MNAPSLVKTFCTYFVEVDAEGVGGGIDIGEEQLLAPLGKRQRNSGPSSIDMQPYIGMTADYESVSIGYGPHLRRMHSPTSRISATLSIAPEDVVPIVATVAKVNTER